MAGGCKGTDCMGCSDSASREVCPSGTVSTQLYQLLVSADCWDPQWLRLCLSEAVAGSDRFSVVKAVL